MRPTLMLQAVVQRIFFSNFAEVQNADFEFHNFQKYTKVIANELKLGVADLELIFHETSQSALITPKTNFKTSQTQQGKIKEILYRMFTKQSVLEYSEENKKKVIELLYKLRKDKQLKATSELILFANQLYYHLSLNSFRKCLDLFQKQEANLKKKQTYIECIYVQSKIFSAIIMLKMRINDEKNIDQLFQKAFQLREQLLNKNFVINKSYFMKRYVYLKLKHVEILIEKQKYTKALARFQEYQSIFSKDQQGYAYLKNVLVSRVSNMRKVVNDKIKQRIILTGQKSEVSLPSTPRERSKSIRYFRLARTKSKDQKISKKEVFIDLSNPFYRIKRTKSNNTLSQVQLQEMYKNVKEVKDKKLFPSDISNQLNKIRESINNRGTGQPELTKKRTLSRATSKSKSSIYPNRKTDLRLLQLRQLHSLPALNTIKFLFFDYNKPSMCTVNLDEQQRFQVMTIQFQNHSMKKQFNKMTDPEQLQSQWSSLKYVFRKYLRGDEVFREIDKYTKIPNQDVSEEVISKYYKCKFQNFDIVEIVELKQLIKTFLSFNYFRFREPNGYKIAFVRKFNWQNILSRTYLKKKLNSLANMDDVLKTAPKFNLLLPKLSSKVYGFQYSISREFKIYQVIVYFKREYFENYIYQFSDTPKQQFLEVDVRLLMGNRQMNIHSKADKQDFKEYQSVKIPLSLLNSDRGIQPHQISKYLLDILVNNYYNKYFTKYFIALFTNKSNITYEQQLIFSFEKNNKLFQDPFNTIPRNNNLDTTEVNVAITEIQQPYLTNIQSLKRRFNSYLVRKLSSMQTDEEMESLKDTCAYMEKRLSKYFGGRLYIVEIRILKSRKRTTRQWEWAAYFYANCLENKITHKFSINSNDQKLLGFQNELMRDLSLQEKMDSLFRYLSFVSRGPYRSLCLKYPHSNSIHSNCMNYVRLGKKNIGLLSKYQLCRTCQYTRVIKMEKNYVVMSVYHLKWDSRMLWEVEFSLNNGEVWICEINIHEIFGFLLERKEGGDEYFFSETKNELMQMWKQIFEGEISFIYDEEKEQNYLKLKNKLFKVDERLTILTTKHNQITRHIDIKLVSKYPILKSSQFYDKQPERERQFKIQVFQDNQVMRSRITYRELDAMFKFQNNGQLLSQNRKSYRVIIEFILDKLQQILLKAQFDQLTD